MKTNLKVTKISTEDMLNHSDQEYNPKVWKESITRYMGYTKCQFYFIAPDGIYSYTRFFVSYIADGIYFFSNFSAYSGSLTNNGFCKVHIDENGEVYKFMFYDHDG